MKIGVFDCETDPFKIGRISRPFSCEFYSDDQCIVHWGDDCIEKMMHDLSALPDKYMIYAHNGGKFDFHFLYPYLDNPIRIIKGRIIEAKLFNHTLRDSYSIIPVAQKVIDKQDVTEEFYEKFEYHVREKHKKEILEYLHSDCYKLYNIVCAFVERFGKQITIGKTAMAELQKLHSFERMTQDGDALFRKFYYGGRVQCFRTGILKGNYKLYDVNSMYPYVMRNYDHPVNCSFKHSSNLPDDFDVPFFAHIRAKNRGALPCVVDGSLSFNVPHGDFFACSHEIKVGLEYDLIDIEDVYACYIPIETIRFESFVDTFSAEKVRCKREGDRLGEQFAKFMLNSCYGKFGQNPANYFDWLLCSDEEEMILAEQSGYEMYSICEYFALYRKPAEIKDTAFFDVSIAASITSAARSVLLEAINNADDPLYCDTDSLICKNLNVKIDDAELGAWKLETKADYVAIAGKKLYSMFNVDESGKRKSVKLASKGGRLNVDQIVDICNGATIEYENPVPTFSAKMKPEFVKRKFKMTG